MTWPCRPTRQLNGLGKEFSMRVCIPSQNLVAAQPKSEAKKYLENNAERFLKC
jgi:hypothetical protein